MVFCPISVSAFAFDLDGTLVDSLPDLASASNRMLSRLNRPSVSEDRVRSYVGKGIDVLVHKLMGEFPPKLSSPKEILFKARVIFREEYENGITTHSRIFPGVVDTLLKLKKKNIPLACVTNKPERHTEIVLKNLELKQYFDLVISGDTCSRMKPDPLPLEYLGRVFGVSLKKVLMIGDSKVDIEAARNAGSPVFCVSYGYHGAVSLDSLGADMVIESVRDIFPLVNFDVKS